MRFAPGLQLLDGGGTKRIARGQHDAAPVIEEAPGQLANGCGFSGTIDAHHQDDKRLLVVGWQQRFFDRLENVEQGTAQAGLQRIEVFEFAPRQSFLQVADNTFGRIDTHIRHDQPGFEFFQHILVNLAARGQVREIVGEPAVALVEACTQPLDEARSLVFLWGVFCFSEHG